MLGMSERRGRRRRSRRREVVGLVWCGVVLDGVVTGGNTVPTYYLVIERLIPTQIDILRSDSMATHPEKYKQMRMVWLMFVVHTFFANRIFAQV